MLILSTLGVLDAPVTPTNAELEIAAVEVRGDGNGCPAGSFDYDVSSDTQFLTFRFFDFAVQASGGAYDRKTCRLRVDVRPPAGWSVGIDAAELRGWGSLSDSSAMAHVDANYRVDDSRYAVDLVRRSYRGAAQGDLVATGYASGVQYTNCNDLSSKSIDLELQLTAETRGASTAEIREPRLGGSIDQVYRLVWRRCGSGPNPNPNPNPGNWLGECRVVHETIWGSDIGEYYGYGSGRSEREAISQARRSGTDRCEQRRNGDTFSRCTVDESSCFAQPRS